MLNVYKFKKKMTKCGFVIPEDKMSDSLSFTDGKVIAFMSYGKDSITMVDMLLNEGVKIDYFIYSLWK